MELLLIMGIIIPLGIWVVIGTKIEDRIWPPICRLDVHPNMRMHEPPGPIVILGGVIIGFIYIFLIYKFFIPGGC